MLDFQILMNCWLFWKRIKWSCKTIFMTQKSFKNFDAVWNIRMRTIDDFHLFCCVCTTRPYTTQNMVQSMHYKCTWHVWLYAWNLVNYTTTRHNLICNPNISCNILSYRPSPIVADIESDGQNGKNYIYITISIHDPNYFGN